jgi:UDP-N-acetylglucosamine 3-dehydrogenase
MNFAIIGLGYWGKNYYRILNSNYNLNLSAVVDPSPKINLDSKIQKFEKLEDLLSYGEKIDAAVVSTPTNTHYEITKNLLNNGINVLVEKPIATKSSEAEELLNLAKKNKLALLVDHTFLYNEAINFAIENIKKGDIGSLLHINFERTNLGPIRNDVSCLWDLTAHDVSILNAIISQEPTQINASSFNTSKSEAFDMVNISLNYENNLFVTMFSSWLHPEKTRKIRIVGDKKMIVFDDLNINEPIKIYDKKFDQIYDKQTIQNNANSYFSFSIGDIVIPYIQNDEPLQKVIHHFVSLINNKIDTEYLNNDNNLLRTVSLLEAIENEIKLN